MTLKILTPTQSRTVSDAAAVFLPGSAGAFEVLRDHAPLISTLSEGKVSWRSASGVEESFAVKSGAVMVRDNEITVCAEV